LTLARPAFLRSDFWSAKRIAILIGFTLAALSTLGPQFYVGPIEDLGGDADQSAKVLTSRIETLRAAQSQYLLFEQMGVLVYALNATGMAAEGSPQRDTLNNLYQLSLLDRSTAVRQMIGELAKARRLDYRTTSEQYGELVSAARKTVSLASYKAVDDFENGTMDNANALMVGLQQALLAAEGAKSGYDGLASRRKLHMLILTALGSTLLLAANLMSERPAAAPADMGETPAETAAAERLVRLALDEARSLREQPAAEPSAGASQAQNSRTAGN
jgi:hypothetical protein